MIQQVTLAMSIHNKQLNKIFHMNYFLFNQATIYYIYCRCSSN